MNLKFAVVILLLCFVVSQVDCGCLKGKIDVVLEKTRNLFRSKNHRVAVNDTDPDCLKNGMNRVLTKIGNVFRKNKTKEDIQMRGEGKDIPDGTVTTIIPVNLIEETTTEENTLGDRFLFKINCNKGFEYINGRCRAIS